jgi:hypothetical protein
MVPKNPPALSNYGLTTLALKNQPNALIVPDGRRFGDFGRMVANSDIGRIFG